MPSSKAVVILGVVTLVVTLAAIFSRQESTAIPLEGERLFPELLAHINEAAEVAANSKDDRFTLVRRDGRWAVKEKHGYIADSDKVHQLLVGMAQLRRVEPKTSNPKLYEKIGVQDVTAEGATSLHIRLKEAGGSTLSELILGTSRASRGDPGLSEYYVRLPGDPQSWLVEGKIPEDKSALNWLDRDILELDAERVREVRVTRPDGQEVVVQRGDPSVDDYELVDLPNGAVVKAQYEVNSIANTLTNLALDDVKPVTDISFHGRQPLSVELTTFDGLRISMQTIKEGKRNFARFQAVFDASLATHGATGVSESTAAEQKNRLKTPDDAKKEAAKLAARWKDWVYAVPQYRIDSLAKKKSELFKVGEQDKSEKTSGG